MHLLRRAAIAAILSSPLILVGCGSNYNPVASVIPNSSANPQATDMVAVLNQNPNTVTPSSATPKGTFTLINVGGDTNVGNYDAGLNSTAVVNGNPTVSPVVPPRKLITFAGANTYIAAANPTAGNVTVTNPSTLVTSAVSLLSGSTPTGIAATSTTGLVLVSLQGVSTATCPSGGALGGIQASTAALTGWVCLSSSSPDFILVIPGDQKALVLDAVNSTTSFVNLSSGSVSSNSTAFSTPVWAAANSSGSRAYVLNQGGRSITTLDTVGESIIGTVTPGTLSTPMMMIADNVTNRLYISDSGNNTVTMLDNSGTLPALPTTIPVGTAPVSLAVTPDGSKVYVANTGAATVSVINTSSLRATSISTPNSTNVNWVAVSKNGTRAYFATAGKKTYIVLTASNTLLKDSSGNAVAITAPRLDSSCEGTIAGCAVTTDMNFYQVPLQIVPGQ